MPKQIWSCLNRSFGDGPFRDRVVFFPVDERTIKICDSVDHSSLIAAFKALFPWITLIPTSAPILTFCQRSSPQSSSKSST